MNIQSIPQEMLVQMEEMTDKQMENILYELSKSEYWSALIKYTVQRCNVAQSPLFTTNAHQDPRTISIHQGMIMGLQDLIGAIEMITKKRKIKKEYN